VVIAKENAFRVQQIYQGTSSHRCAETQLFSVFRFPVLYNDQNVDFSENLMISDACHS